MINAQNMEYIKQVSA